MNYAPLIAEVERRGREAWKTPQGPDYAQIVADVACENDVIEKELRNACTDAWTTIAGAG